MENIILGIMFIVFFVVAGSCCIPPLLQAIEYKHKPTIVLSIVCMIIMLVLVIAMIYKICVGFP